MKAFISYSHKDSAHLERLHTHLAVLRREGAINAWYDREILGGGKIDQDVMARLEDCDLFLALVSPDFLASNYCYETEMNKAMEQDAAGKTRIVPIILEPCDWKSTPLQQFKALPRDGKPISEWQNVNTAFLDIVHELRRIVIEATRPQNVSTPSVATPAPTAEPRRYRTKRDFDAIDRNDFRDDAFKKIRDYIQSAIMEIDGIENIKARFVSTGPYSFSCTILNRAKNRGLGSLTVHAATGSHGISGDIYYSFSENAPANTANGGFQIDADDYDLFLKRSYLMTGNQTERLTAQQAAEVIWNELLERAGVSYA